MELNINTATDDSFSKALSNWGLTDHKPGDRFAHEVTTVVFMKIEASLKGEERSLVGLRLVKIN